MVKIEFVGSAAEVLAEMRLLAFVEPLVPLPEVIKAVAAPEPEPEREPELPRLSLEDLGEIIDKKEAEIDEAAARTIVELAPARKRRTKAEMEAARAAEAAAAGAAHEVPAPVAEIVKQQFDVVDDGEIAAEIAAEDSADRKTLPLTFEDVKGALKELCEADGLGVEAAQKLLKQFGVSRLSLLDAARWGEFYESARHLVEPLV